MSNRLNTRSSFVLIYVTKSVEFNAFNMRTRSIPYALDKVTELLVSAVRLFYRFVSIPYERRRRL